MPIGDRPRCRVGGSGRRPRPGSGRERRRIHPGRRRRHRQVPARQGGDLAGRFARISRPDRARDRVGRASSVPADRRGADETGQGGRGARHPRDDRASARACLARPRVDPAGRRPGRDLAAHTRRGTDQDADAGRFQGIAACTRRPALGRPRDACDRRVPRRQPGRDERALPGDGAGQRAVAWAGLPQVDHRQARRDLRRGAPAAGLGDPADGTGVPGHRARTGRGGPAARRLRRAPLRGGGTAGRRRLVRASGQGGIGLAGRRPGHLIRARLDHGIGAQSPGRARPGRHRRPGLSGRARQEVRLDAAAEHRRPGRVAGARRARSRRGLRQAGAGRRSADRRASGGRGRPAAAGAGHDHGGAHQLRAPLRCPAARLAAARSIADQLHDADLASRVDAAAARCAIDSGHLDQADVLARRALASAEAAGSASWAAEVAFEALEVIGRRERQRDTDAARSAFERAYQIATDAELAIRRIGALHELGTVDMLTDGGTARLREARELARGSGAISTATTIDLQLASTWSLGSDLDRALDAARQAERGARQIAAGRTEAIAINIQAVVAAIRGDRAEPAKAAERAEQVIPGDPEVLYSTWGLARVTASLFLDDPSRALRESEAGISYGGDTALMPPRRAWGYYAILQAAFGRDGRAAVEQAHAASAAIGWNEGYLCYAQAVLEGREGHRERASALAEEGSALLAPYAPWWNHLARRLIAQAALRDGWGQPAAWLREAAAEFQASGHARLASACRGILRRAGERVPRSGRGTAQVPAQMRRLGITSREMDVFLLVARGISNAEIAQRLFISPKTVETHVASLVAKTGQAGRRELVGHAARFVPH